MTLVASTTPRLSRLASELSPITLRANTASPSRSTVAASTPEMRWYGNEESVRAATSSKSWACGAPPKSRGTINRAPASTCVPSNKSGQRQVGNRDHVGSLGQLECQPAQAGCRAADLRQIGFVGFVRASGIWSGRGDA